MSRAIVSKPILDTLIRAKLSNLNGCAAIEPLPVVWRETDAQGCNWRVPGWAGDGDAVKRCTGMIQDYIRFLQDQFNIPEEA